MDELLTVKQVAKLLQLHEMTIRRYRAGIILDLSEKGFFFHWILSETNFITEHAAGASWGVHGGKFPESQ